MVPFQLQYELNRRQRLVPHLVIWFPYSAVYLGAAAMALFASVRFSPWHLLLFVLALWLLRGFLVGLLDVALNPIRRMDVVVEENGLGYLDGGERWYIFLDGILNVGMICRDTWTVYHYNGTVINIPAAAITRPQIDYLLSAAQRAQTRRGQENQAVPSSSVMRPRGLWESIYTGSFGVLAGVFSVPLLWGLATAALAHLVPASRLLDGSVMGMTILADGALACLLFRRARVLALTFALGAVVIGGALLYLTI
jgi:hypothetical protein